MLNYKQIQKDPSTESWFKKLNLTEADVKNLYFDFPSSENHFSEQFFSEGYLLILDDQAVVVDLDWKCHIIITTDLPLERDVILKIMAYTNKVADKTYGEGTEEGKRLAKAEFRAWLNS